MADVFQRNGKWVARWYRPDGSRVKRSTGETKRREAERVAAEWEAKDRKTEGLAGKRLLSILDRATAEARAGKLTATKAEEYLLEIRRCEDPDFRTVTLKSHLKDWQAAQDLRVSPSTSAGYRQTVAIVSKLLGKAALSAPVGDLTAAQVAKLQDGLAKGRKAATANLHFRNFRRALTAAVRAQLMTFNPAEGIRPLPESDSIERAPFSASEVRAMIDHGETSDEWRGAILLAAHTGLRLGDVVSLGAKHLEGTRLVIRPAKTARSRKTLSVPLTPPCLAWIDGKKGDWFPSLVGEKKGTLSTQFRRIMARAQVPAVVALPGGIVASRSFHSLRHSFASWLAEADIHADVRRKLTGHSSAGVHALYTHHDESLDRAIASLPRFAD